MASNIADMKGTIRRVYRFQINPNGADSSPPPCGDKPRAARKPPITRKT